MLRVVVVEDEYYVRKGIIKTFDWKSLDCEIVGEASNGREGTGVIEELKPDLVIADIEMPVADGIEMVRLLKEKRCCPAFIFLTAHQKFAYVHSALKLEAVDYLLKPFTGESLEESISKVKLRLLRTSGNRSAAPRLPENGRLTEPETLEAELLLAKNLYIKKAVLFVRDHYCNEIGAVDAANHLNISEAYFCRLFKKETGYTFGQYLTNYRIYVAAGLLANFPMKINEVAEQAGFSDSSYFSLIFKKTMGMPPTEYQELKRTF